MAPQYLIWSRVMLVLPIGVEGESEFALDYIQQKKKDIAKNDASHLID